MAAWLRYADASCWADCFLSSVTAVGVIQVWHQKVWFREFHSHVLWSVWLPGGGPVFSCSGFLSLLPAPSGVPSFGLEVAEGVEALGGLLACNCCFCFSSSCCCSSTSPSSSLASSSHSSSSLSGTSGRSCAEPNPKPHETHTPKNAKEWTTTKQQTCTYLR